MGNYRLSSKAVQDLAGIYEYTILTFGLGQARRYFEELQNVLTMLTERPELDRKVSFSHSDMIYYYYIKPIPSFLPENKTHCL